MFRKLGVPPTKSCIFWKPWTLILPQKGDRRLEIRIKIKTNINLTCILFWVFYNCAFSYMINHFRQPSIAGKPGISRISGISGFLRLETLFFETYSQEPLWFVRTQRNVVFEIADLQFRICWTA